MAYAFNALDNYFKRTKEKTAGAGDLQKGAGTGAPPPTAAADGLAKRAETSGEMGNSASRFEAMQKGPVGSIASRLAEPGRQKAASWQAGAEQQGQQYKTAGEKQMKDTFKDFDPNQVSKAEAGEEGATSELGQQLGYGNTSFDLAPMQIEVPTLDTTSMLRSGVGGLQAALQKRGGRYTPGMAAMDASALAANRGAIQQLQGQFGNIQQGMREKAGELRGLEGQLEAAGKQRGQDIAGQVREALGSRSKQLGELWQRGAAGRAAEREEQGRAGARGQARKYHGLEDTTYMPITETGTQLYQEAADPAYANLLRLLGLDIPTYEQSIATYAPDYGTMDTRLAQIKAENDAARAEVERQRAAGVSVPVGSGGMPEVQQQIKQLPTPVETASAGVKTIPTPIQMPSGGTILSDIGRESVSAFNPANVNRTTTAALQPLSVFTGSNKKKKTTGQKILSHLSGGLF